MEIATPVPAATPQSDVCWASPKLFTYLDAWEIGIVRKIAHASSGRIAFPTCVFINHLGNGWLYAMVGILWISLAGSDAWRFRLIALISVVVSHLLYASIKPRLARIRPCDLDPTLRLTVKALDEYSCPSGHSMTATAVGIPLALAATHMIPAIVGVWLLIAWSRVSLGHHYPSDIVCGAILGGGVSLMISLIELLRL